MLILLIVVFVLLFGGGGGYYYGRGVGGADRTTEVACSVLQ